MQTNADVHLNSVTSFRRLTYGSHDIVGSIDDLGFLTAGTWNRKKLVKIKWQAVLSTVLLAT